MSRTKAIPVITREMTTTWQPSKINTALDRLEKLDRALTSEFIEAGRGHERPSDIWQLNDPLAERYKKISRSRDALHGEIAHRYGPSAPSRLPRGFGPIKGY